MLHVVSLNDSVAHDLLDELLGPLIDLVDQSLTTRLNSVKRGTHQGMALVAPDKSLVGGALDDFTQFPLVFQSK